MEFSRQAKDVLNNLVSLARDHRSHACVSHLLYYLLHTDDIRYLVKTVLSFDTLNSLSAKLVTNEPKITGLSKKTQLLVAAEELSKKVCAGRGGMSVTLNDLLYALIVQAHPPIVEVFIDSTNRDCFGIYDIHKALVKNEGRKLNFVIIDEEGNKTKCGHCKKEIPAEDKYCDADCEIKALLSQQDRRRNSYSSYFSYGDEGDYHYGYGNPDY